jgi:hypothetical protein
MHFYKRPWDENRGDQFADWGTSIYFFETDSSGHPVRQMEIYQNGTVLQYSSIHQNDDYGMLADQPLERSDFIQFEISKEEFEEAWDSAKPLNA